jgi:rhodanese-related sulfurtransferase
MKKILYLLSAISLISCGNTNAQIIENIEAPQFQSLTNKENGIIIDVRTPEEFCSGHIKDATNIDFYSDKFIEKLRIVRKDVPIYVYCRSGGRSSSAANKMEELGFTKVYNLVGGIGAWDSENYPTIKSKEENLSSQPTFTVLEIEADVNKELIKKHQIKGVPVFIVFKNSKEVFRHVGVVSKEELLKQLN